MTVSGRWVLQRLVLAVRVGRNRSCPLTCLGCGPWARKFQNIIVMEVSGRTELPYVSGQPTSGYLQQHFERGSASSLLSHCGRLALCSYGRYLDLTKLRSVQNHPFFGDKIGDSYDPPYDHTFLAFPYYDRLWERSVAVEYKIEPSRARVGSR